MGVNRVMGYGRIYFFTLENTFLFPESVGGYRVILAV
jgi:hypothetical protein